MIEVEDLVFEYPEARVLHDVSFQLPVNSVTALVGPNGAGKTTLLRCMAALERPFSGTVNIGGADTLRNPRGVHAEVGFLYDFYGLYDELTVLKSLRYRAAAQGVRSELCDEYVQQAINRLGLAERVDQKAGTLSRGWRQKLSIALAIVHDPQVILLDEPASGLDPEAREELSALFRALQAEGKTLVVSSHILGELEDYSSHLLMIRDGRVAPLKELHGSATGAEGHEPQDSTVVMRVEFTGVDAGTALRDRLAALPGVTLLDGDEANPNLALLVMDASPEARHRVLHQMIDQGLPVAAFERQRSNLKDAYRDSLQSLS